MSQSDREQSRVVLNLLDAIERDGEQSQRAMADCFGIALGLVNAYLKHCIKNGYVTVRPLPRRRYIYALTPKGMTEKLRLTLALMSKELTIFRRARVDYRAVYAIAASRGWRRIVLIGASELAEISVICALEADIKIVAMVDPDLGAVRFAGVPVAATLAEVATPYDGALITEARNPQDAYTRTATALSANGVLAPAFFGFPAWQEHAA